MESGSGLVLRDEPQVDKMPQHTWQSIWHTIGVKFRMGIPYLLKLLEKEAGGVLFHFSF